MMRRAAALLAVASVGAWTAPAAAGPVLGSEACQAGTGPAIRADITGLKDRKGDLKLELYPADEEDFLAPDRQLLAAGKTFERISVPVPASGPVSLCLKVPRPGRYALLFTHNRDGKRKFSLWVDGAGFPSNRRLGRSRPKVGEALIDVGAGITVTAITAQYLRGLGGFAPLDR